MKTLVLATTDEDVLAATPFIEADIVHARTFDEAIDAVLQNPGAALAYGPDAMGLAITVPGAWPPSHDIWVLYTDRERLDWRVPLEVAATCIFELPAELPFLHEALNEDPAAARSNGGQPEGLEPKAPLEGRSP